jgi:dipeptidyl aminopeptidase/acylaminoacyl peptidase
MHPEGLGRRNSWSRGWLGLALVLIGLTFSVQVAAMKRVDPGEIPQLRPDEGLLLVAVDSNIALESVRVRKDGKLFGAGVLARLPVGRNLRLYVASAGRYEWSRIGSFANIRYTLSDDPEYHFEVKPGSITYAGDLIFRPTGYFSAHIHVSNRGLAALDWLQAEHPTLLQRYPFTYVGYYPDPFPAFYQEARQTADAKTGPFPAMQAPPAPGALPLPPKDLWQDDHLSLVKLNPTGDLLALQVKENGKQSWAIDLIDLTTGKAQRIARSEFAFASIYWSGNNSLLIALGNTGKQQIINVVNIGNAKDGKRNLQHLKFPRIGQILDVLPYDPQHVLFASLDSSGNLMIHKVDISSEKALGKFRATASQRLNAGTKDDVWWFADGQGNLRVATTRREDESVLVYRGADGLTELMRLHADRGFDPIALSFDGTLIYGLTDEDRTQRDLVEFDIVSKRITRTLFSKPGVDIVSPLFDHRRKPVGVRYYQSGRLVSEYFEQHDQSLAGVLEKAFPNRTVAVLDQSIDARQLILWVDGSDQPPKLYHLDVAQRRASLIDEVMPWLGERRFAPSQVVRTRGRDGLPIESYLTLPPGSDRHPLIVLAHGGPVGVSDNLHFDRDVQFLASLGYAVLRVNFRGSGGFGKAFREAGYRNFGTLIEDDIDAALKQVLADYPIDPKRLCAVGFSYGGYSALVSAVRWPDRFQCVVSVSGVSDRLLFFTASDGGRSKAGRSQLEKIVGDPNSQQTQMMESSPLYHYRNIRVPVMLAHGQEDWRVDFEHTRRMQRMLDLAGHSPVGLIYPEEGHSFSKDEDLHTLWTGIAGFLQRYLDGGRKVEAAAVQ